ncbi:hypothetical protein OB2597_09144 [Pseudooceanicola batsensis HTCC2597]|uniref:Uncharacterized protein n=1 Tax=Pseudooceanicola batsensis (strain ATCC BAA-863 / DSM 15984 / KCTC 12145 / HTCC2597) TaxID=252305 RepID=A3TUV1_PSEBH|nr:hypothetical protein [Pseudooceanicola batsensis]EAQ04297.1 hypothetical protein OB2597_09144 [Pseudooceanicola batsensis HTCC2597]
MKYFYASLFFGLGLATSAQGGTFTPYTNEATYVVATSGDTLFFDFDGLPSGSADGVFSGVDFNTINAVDPSRVIYGSGALTDTGNPSSRNNVGTLEGVLDVEAFAIGFELLSVEAEGRVDFFDSSDVLVGSVNYASSGGFVGMVTDMPVASFLVQAGIFSSGGADRVFIDDFRVSSPAAVPLPASGLLLLAGILALAPRRRART